MIKRNQFITFRCHKSFADILLRERIDAVTEDTWPILIFLFLSIKFVNRKKREAGPHSMRPR